MGNALIGYTGFVGSTLLKQASFDSLYRSTNINEIAGKEFDCIVCAGAPAQKWLANKEPEQDLEQIKTLIKHLSSCKTNMFILISTVDVFGSPLGVYEDSEVVTDGLHPYGRHRLMLEEFVAKTFSRHLIVRLPGLVGPGLKKNIIFDFLNSNNIDSIESRNEFQFYPMVNLWPDIQKAVAAELNLIHLTAEPIQVQRVAEEGFGLDFVNEKPFDLIKYDMRTRFSDLYSSGESDYHYSERETLMAIRAYAQSEPKLIV
jgi:hypothetical protein